MTPEQKQAHATEIITFSSGNMSFITAMAQFMLQWLEEHDYDPKTAVTNMTDKGWEVVAFFKED